MNVTQIDNLSMAIDKHFRNDNSQARVSRYVLFTPSKEGRTNRCFSLCRDKQRVLGPHYKKVYVCPVTCGVIELKERERMEKGEDTKSRAEGVEEY